MGSFRGEEQSGFLGLVGTWLSQQSWFQAAPGRRVITRTGGLRIPLPEGDPDRGLHLEMHIFQVVHAAGQARVAVPMALRTRPSALAGKTAFIGRLAAADGDLWVYDGARDRAFLAAWHEMARRQQGSRNGRSRGEALADFGAWPAFPATLQRTPMDEPAPGVARTAVTNEGGDGETRTTVVDFIRRPDPQRSASLDTALRLTRNGSRSIARVLGVVTGSWTESDPTTDERHWATGDVSLIREAVLGAAPASDLVRSAVHEGSDFVPEASRLGRLVGDFHADLAGTFGAYPQTAPQLQVARDAAATALRAQWEQVREGLADSESTSLADIVTQLSVELENDDQSMSLQRIHGDLTVDRIRCADQEGDWIIDEDGGMADDSLALDDVASVLVSLAQAVLEAAAKNADPVGTGAAATDLGRWYEQVTEAVLAGYRSSDAAAGVLESAVFHALMLTEALKLFHRWDARWVFRPSLLLRREV